MSRSTVQRVADGVAGADFPSPPRVPAARVRPPRPAPHAVRRIRLERRLDAAIDHDVVLVTAPAGYGKTTALTQWVSTLGPAHPVRWLTLATDDNDPRRLAMHLSAAVAAGEPDISDALDGAAADASDADVVAPVVRALERQAQGTVVVLSRVETVTSHAALGLLGDLLADLPAGIRLVLDTRRRPSLPVDRLRAAGRLDEIGSDALRFDLADTAALSDRLGCPLDERSAGRLVRHAGGWPAALFLTLRSYRIGAELPSAHAPPQPDVIDFVTTEVLDPLDPGERDLLEQLAVIGETDADLVGEITGDPSLSLRFEALRRTEPIIERADPLARRYRVEPVVGAVARSLLEQEQPATAARIRSRASSALASRGQFETSLRHAVASGEPGVVRDALCRSWSVLPMGSPVVSAALRELGDEAVVGDPELALVAAWRAGALREWRNLDRYLAHCEGVDDRPAASFTSASSGASLCRAAFGVGGLEETRAAALGARHERDVRWRALAAVRSAWCQVIAGVPARALEPLARADVTIVEEDLATDPWSELIRPLAAAVRAIALADVGLLDQAGAAADQASTAAAMGGRAPTAMAWCLRALGGVLARRGRHAEALPLLEEALRLHRSRPTDRNGWPLVELLLTIVPVRWREAERAAATTALTEARALLRRQSDAGVLPRRLAALERQVSTWAVSRARIGLTPREIEILRLVLQGRTRQQAAGELHVSVNTVKSHLRSAYRKLGATSRGDALARARSAGVL